MATDLLLKVAACSQKEGLSLPQLLRSGVTMIADLHHYRNHEMLQAMLCVQIVVVLLHRKMEQPQLKRVQ